VATEAAGAQAARFLPLPFSSLGQLVQPVKMGCIKNLVAVASSKSVVALGPSTIRQMAMRAPPEGVGGRTRRPQGGSPHGSLARDVPVLFAQESRAQFRSQNGHDDCGECLMRNGAPGLLGEIGV
jgi:hypothetical protein